MSYMNYVQEDNKWKNRTDLQKPNYGKKDYYELRFEKTVNEWRKYCEFWKSYPDRFLDFVSDENTKYKLFFYHRLLLRIFFRYHKVFVTASRGSAKCVTGDTLLFTENGMKEIGSLVNYDTEEKEVDKEVKLLDGFNEMQNTNVIFVNGKRKTKKVKTSYGFEIEGSYNHPILVMKEDGYFDFKNLEDIQEGDYVAISRGNNVFGNKTNIDVDNAYRYGVLTLSENYNEIPEDILCSNKEVICAFLEGLFRNKTVAKVKHEKMSKQIQIVLSNLGVIASRTWNDEIGMYLICIKEVTDDVIPYQNDNKEEYYLHGLNELNYFWDKVSEVEDNENYVYDISVSNSFTYCGNSFVNHNSYLQILANYLKCIMFPSIKIFICAPGKQQSAQISQEKIEEIWENYPALKNEVRHHSFQKDYTKLTFQNNSKLDIVQMKDTARGGRRHSGSVEEIASRDFDGDTLQQVVIPLMAVNRTASCGAVDPNELHKSQFYITTAGEKQNFAYKKMQEIMREMVQTDRKSFNIGWDYQLPVMHGLSDLDSINDEKESETMSPLGFSREYLSIWTGSSEDSFVDLEDLNKCRTLSKAEEKASNSKKDKDAEYVLSYDVARVEGNSNANSALCVLKILPRGDGTYQKQLVNIYSFQGVHFLEQALFLKQKVNEFNARILVVDSAGLGVGLVDQLVLEIDENPPYAIINDDSYDKFRSPDSIPILFTVSSQKKDTKASNIHNVLYQHINNQKVKLLKPESVAKAELLKDKKRPDPEKIANELRPFAMTDLLCDEIMNLEYKQSGNETVVKQVSRGIPKDKFSAFEYGVYYIHTLEKKNKMRQSQKVDVKKFMKVKKPTMV